MSNKLKLVISQYLIVFVIICIPVSLSFAQESSPGISKGNLKIFVQYRLAKASLLKDNNINVEIGDDQIILSGTVQTIYDKDRAGRVAHSVAEDYVIVNNIQVNNEAVEDSTLTKEVLSKVRSNIFYGVFDWLTVNSDSGVVTLEGWVHLPWLKNQFESEVEKVPGVKNVINKIQITFGPGALGYRAARLIYNDPMFWGQQYSSNPPIHIIVENGSVLLYGDVNSYVEKDWAENIISFRTDAITVDNNLRVTG